MSQILLVDADMDAAETLSEELQLEGYATELAASAREALARARAAPPDLVLLDLALPQMDSYRVLKNLKRESPLLPVLVVAEGASEADRVLAWNYDADGLLWKPIGPNELMARIESRLRLLDGFRTGAPKAREIYGFADVQVDARARTVHRRGHLVPLSPKALDLLLMLLRNDGAVISREEISKEVWGHKTPIKTRTVDQHVCEIRRKLEEDPRQPRFILTVRKGGYRFRLP